MVDVVKSFAKERKNDEAIIFQHGNTQCDIKDKNIVLYKQLPFTKMEQYIKQARIIITHGGPATIYQSLSAGKIPYVLPREKKYREHINDHQVRFCRFLEEKKRIVLINKNNLYLYQRIRQDNIRKIGEEIVSMLLYLDTFMIVT